MNSFNNGGNFDGNDGDYIEPENNFRNSTILNLEDIKMDSNFAWLLCSLVSGMVWVIYISYYHSRVLGYILTRILNRNMFLKQGYMHVGSFTWSVLSGKIMFRDVVYMTNDFTLRVQDGWIIFRWWRSYVPKNLSEDLSHSDTRLSVMLNGSELHMYNRTTLYANLEKIFGLESQIIAKEEQDNKEDGEMGVLSSQRGNRTPNISSSSWRDLIPVIKVDVLSGKEKAKYGKSDRSARQAVIIRKKTVADAVFEASTSTAVLGEMCEVSMEESVVEEVIGNASVIQGEVEVDNKITCSNVAIQCEMGKESLKDCQQRDNEADISDLETDTSWKDQSETTSSSGSESESNRQIELGSTSLKFETFFHK